MATTPYVSPLNGGIISAANVNVEQTGAALATASLIFEAYEAILKDHPGSCIMYSTGLYRKLYALKKLGKIKHFYPALWGWKEKESPDSVGYDQRGRKGQSDTDLSHNFLVLYNEHGSVACVMDPWQSGPMYSDSNNTAQSTWSSLESYKSAHGRSIMNPGGQSGSLQPYPAKEMTDLNKQQ